MRRGLNQHTPRPGLVFDPAHRNCAGGRTGDENTIVLFGPITSANKKKYRFGLFPLLDWRGLDHGQPNVVKLVAL